MAPENELHRKPRTWHRHTAQSDSDYPLLGHIKYGVIGSAYRVGRGFVGFKPPPKFRRPSKIVPTSTQL